MVQFVSDVGSKYKQSVTPNTPSYAATGVRMEDSFGAFRGRGGGGLVLVVADGHGSTKVSDGVVVGGRKLTRRARPCGPTVAPRPDGALPEEPARHTGQGGGAGAAADCSRRAVRVRAWPGDVELSARGTTLSVCRVCPARDSWFAGWRQRRFLGAWRRRRPPHAHGTKNKAEAQRCPTRRQGGRQVFRVPHGRLEARIMLSRALGHVGHDPISKTPDVVHFVPYAGDKLVVATDGLWDCISVARAGQVVAAAATEADACAALLEAYRASKHPRDNVAIACHFVEGAGHGCAACVVQ